MKIKLLHGDCLERMNEIEDNTIDMVCCDPPYGTTACKWDIVIPFEPMWKQLNRICKPSAAVVLFGNQPFTSLLICSNIKMFKYELVWIKERPVNILQIKKRAGKNVENVVIFYKSQCTYNPQKIFHGGKLRTNVIKNGKLGKLIDNGNKLAVSYRDDRSRFPLQTIKFNRDILKINLHPTQKPLALIEYLIKTYTNESDNVLDFAMGSGTAGIACKNLNRNFIGIEKDDNYFRIAKDRIINGDK